VDKQNSDRKCYILLTGASSGIGRNIAIKLSATNNLILNGRDESRLNETRLQCEEPDNHLIWRYDLSDIEGLGNSIKAYICEHDILVKAFIHCAGIFRLLPFRQSIGEVMEQTLRVNMVSAFEIMAALTQKKTNAKALNSAVFISSIASQFGAKGLSAYCASKGALDSLMRALAVELAPDVRVNSILPGGIITEMTEEVFEDPDMMAKFKHDYPLGIGHSDDIANMVEFLISEKARWITGQQIVIDGGRTVNITA